MSIEAMAHVFKNPSPKASVTLVWLAVADSVNEQNTYDFWMSNESLQKKTGLSESTVRRALQELVEYGCLRIKEERPGVSVCYQFIFGDPDQDDTRGFQDDTPNPCQVDTLTQGTNSSKPNLANQDSRDEVFDAVMDVCKMDPKSLTDSSRGAANKAVKELKKIGADEGDIYRHASAYKRTFPNAALTPMALVKNWNSLGLDTVVRELYPGASQADPVQQTDYDYVGKRVLTDEEVERNQARIRELKESIRAKRQ